MRNDLASNNKILITNLIDKIKSLLKIATKTESIKWSMKKRNDFTQLPIVQHVKGHITMLSSRPRKQRHYHLNDNPCMGLENSTKIETFHQFRNELIKLPAIII